MSEEKEKEKERNSGDKEGSSLGKEMSVQIISSRAFPSPAEIEVLAIFFLSPSEILSLVWSSSFFFSSLVIHLIKSERREIAGIVRSFKTNSSARSR